MKLKDLIPLKSKITVYVPATVDINKEIVGIGWLRTALWWQRKQRWFLRTVIRRRLKSTSTMLLPSATS